MCWRRVPWTARRSNQSILKELSPEYSLDGLMLTLKLQYFAYLMQRTDSLEETDAGKDWRQEEKGMTENEMVGWHHWHDGHEFEPTLGVGDGQGSLACCSLCSMGSQRVRHNWATELNSFCVGVILFTYNIICKQIILLFFPSWVSFISFSCLITLTRASNSILNRSGKSWHPCLDPN